MFKSAPFSPILTPHPVPNSLEIDGIGDKSVYVYLECHSDFPFVLHAVLIVTSFVLCRVSYNSSDSQWILIAYLSALLWEAREAF